jgi:hypothetical protein
MESIRLTIGGTIKILYLSKWEPFCVMTTNKMYTSNSIIVKKDFLFHKVITVPMLVPAQ